MSMNDSVTLHEPLGKPKGKGGGKHHHHHGGGGRIRFRPLIDPAYYERGYPYYYGDEYGETRSIEDEVAFHEAKHDVIIVSRAGKPSQVRQAVVDRLKSRGWVESTKNGIVLLSPPGFVAAMKGLGLIHGLGVITPEPLVKPAEILGVGVGGAMIVGGVLVEGKVGLGLGIVGGLVSLISVGSAVMRAMQPAPASAVPLPPGATAASPTPAAQYPAVQQQPAMGPPPPPPPKKPSSTERLQAAVQAYGPVAAELIKGVISLF